MQDGPTGPAALAGTTALVTGAAGGIGSSIVRALAAAGAQVAATDVATRSLARLRREAAERPSAVHCWKLDVSAPAQVEATVAEVEESMGPIGLLVNAAGVFGRLAPLVEQEPADFDRLFA